MRKYIRHPSDVPIEFEVADTMNIQQQRLHNVSLGGLSFFASESLALGTLLTIRIPVVQPDFEVQGRVVWCYEWDELWELGVELLDPDQAYHARMVEQICHIEHYKREVWMRDGRRISTEEAAREWIAAHAADFPNIHEVEPHS